MKTLTQDVQEQIEKHLPEQVGKLLKERLERLEALEKENPVLSATIDNKVNEIVGLEGLLKDQHNLLSVAGNLEEREEKVGQRELEQNLFELNAKLEASQTVNARIMDFVDALMRNTEFRRDVSRSYQTIGYGDHAAPAYTGESITETTE